MEIQQYLLVLCGKSPIENDLARFLRNSKNLKASDGEEITISLQSEIPGSSNQAFRIESYMDALSTDRFGRFLIWSPRLASTQDIVSQNFYELPLGSVCVADVQFKGRGWSKNVWESPIGYLLFSFTFQIESSGGISLLQYAVSLAVIEAIKMVCEAKGLPHLDVKIKWPNDLYLDGLKVGGILFTSTYRSKKFNVSAGIGLNVDNDKLTTCLNSKLHQLGSAHQLRKEDILAAFFNKFEVLFYAFMDEGGGTKGFRLPFLAPRPSMLLPVLDKGRPTWDLVRSFAPKDGTASSSLIRGVRDDDESNEDKDEGINGAVGETDQLTGSSSFSTSNDDDSSSSTTKPLSIISPNGRFKRSISLWTRGGHLGSGSFGTVYEGLSGDGFFFAVKEVSLVDQGSQAQECIQQLEQEIALLSQFEHENIVQYLGTEKEEAKLYIFLELVTKGSLANLYQKYHLRDTQVSAYTRQILNGLKYLHDRDVLHRDIKCGNILVDANGSVKLADFGLAKETSKLNKLKSCKGSAYWMAPEVVNPRMTYGLAADIWSLGCSVLEMLTRQPPYYPLEWTQAFFQIGCSIPPPIPNSLSSDAQDFIRQCLRVVPDDRPPASKLLEHPFVRRAVPASVGSGFSSNSDARA